MRELLRQAVLASYYVQIHGELAMVISAALVYLGRILLALCTYSFVEGYFTSYMEM